MVFSTSATAIITILLLLLLHGGSSMNPPMSNDVDRVQFALNLEFLEAEFFLQGALGLSLDTLEPSLTMGGPSPIGVRRANLSPPIRDIITQFAYQEVGHLRAIKSMAPGFSQPLLNLSVSAFANFINNALGYHLNLEFDPYINDINYLLASYVIHYVGPTGYVGTLPKLQNSSSIRLVGGLLGVESGQDAIIRTLLYERASAKVIPYNFTVAEFTDKISSLRDKLGGKGVKDEGIIIEPAQGAKGKIAGNVLAGDEFSMAFDRTPEEILRIVYGSGHESVPGGFYPRGANGKIAKSYL